MNEINLKDFQFSDEELKNMSEGDKVKLIKKIDLAITQTKANATYYSAYQLALKLVLNGSYGAFAHPKFSVSNKYIANSITIHGRDLILYMLSKIEDYFFNQWHLDTNAHLLMSDTFVAFDSENNAYMLTYLNEIVSGRKYDKGDKDSGLQSLMKDWNLTPERLTEIPSEKIKIIFKDKEIELEKRYKRHLADFTKINSIDSSIIEERDNIEGYKTYYHKEDIIQYGDTDSLYISFFPVLNSINFKGDELEFILSLDKLIIKDKFNKWLEDYATKYNVKNIHDFELERINKSALHTEKKMYINNVVYEDGIYYEDMSHFSPKGIDIVRSSTPPFSRGKNQKGGVWDFIHYMFRNSKELNPREIMRIMNDLKKRFMLADIEDISFKTSLNKYEKKVIDDQSNVIVMKGAHFSVKAACFHNYLLNKNPEYKTKYDLLKGGDIKWYYCTHPLNDRFAYARSFHPYEITEKEKIKIDYDEMFDLAVLSIVNKFTKPVGLPEINKRLGFLNSIFDNSYDNIGNRVLNFKKEYPELDSEFNAFDF